MSSVLLHSSARLAIVGATGIVGQTLLQCLEERGFPGERLCLLASSRSSGTQIGYGTGQLSVSDAASFEFRKGDVALFAATPELSAALVPRALERGVLVVDKSSVFRGDPAIPLVVPAINGRLLTQQPSLVSSPNCTTIGVAYALEPLRQAAGLRSVTITTLQAASGAGRDGLDALLSERAGGLAADSPFAARLEDNVVPLCGALEADAGSEEERKLRDELRRILNLPELAIESTCVRVPVAVGHTASLRITTDRPLGLDAARSALAAFPDIDLMQACPTPRAVAGTDRVQVGRLRLAANGDILLVQTADNLRRGAATNALECVEGLLANTPEDPQV